MDLDKGESAVAQALADAGLSIDVGEFAELVRHAVVVVGSGSTGAASQLTETDVREVVAGGLRADAGLGPFDCVRAITVAQTAALYASTLTVAEAAERLRVDPSRIRQMLSERSLLAAKDTREWRILDLQFGGDRLVPNIAVVARDFPDGMPLLAIANWLTSPKADLEVEGAPVSPLEWLSAGGDPERVARLAGDL